MNLRSTTYSEKLIAATVLHTLPALCSCKRVNDVTKWYCQVWKVKAAEEDGSRHWCFQMAGDDDKKPGSLHAL